MMFRHADSIAILFHILCLQNKEVEVKRIFWIGKRWNTKRIHLQLIDFKMSVLLSNQQHNRTTNLCILIQLFSYSSRLTYYVKNTNVCVLVCVFSEPFSLFTDLMDWKALNASWWSTTWVGLPLNCTLSHEWVAVIEITKVCDTIQI